MALFVLFAVSLLVFDMFSASLLTYMFLALANRTLGLIIFFWFSSASSVRIPG